MYHRYDLVDIVFAAVRDFSINSALCRVPRKVDLIFLLGYVLFVGFILFM